MLLTKNWIYLDLQKTGCTFLRENLLEIFPKNIFVQTAKHSVPEINLNIPKIITIRDPEKYYFSLWSYGIDQKGGLYEAIKIYFPEKLDRFYINKSKDCFSHFLDFVLNCSTGPRNNLSKNSFRNFLITKFNNKIEKFRKGKFHWLNKYKIYDEYFWIPRNCDIYTARILRMLIPKSHMQMFSDKLNADFSYQNLEKNLIDYMPEIIIRTSCLNSDFYDYYKKDRLNFLDLPKGWESIFPLHSLPINQSSKSFKNSKQNDISNYFSNYHRDLLKLKCNLSYLLLDEAKKYLG